MASKNGIQDEENHPVCHFFYHGLFGVGNRNVGHTEVDLGRNGILFQNLPISELQNISGSKDYEHVFFCGDFYFLVEFVLRINKIILMKYTDFLGQKVLNRLLNSYQILKSRKKTKRK